MTYDVRSWTPEDGCLSGEMERRFTQCGTRATAAWPSSRSSPEGYEDLVLEIGLENRGQLLVASRGDRDIARAMVLRHPASEAVGVLGLYEAPPGREGDEATEAIIRSALEWAASERLGTLYAPVDVNTWFSYRFPLPSVGGPKAPPVFRWEPDAPPQYLTRFLRSGFSETERFETRALEFPSQGAYTMRNVVEHTKRAHKRALRNGFTFGRVTDGEALGEALGETYQVCMAAFAENPLFAPLSHERFVALYGNAIARTEGHLTFWARDQQNRIVGFVFAFPDGEFCVTKTIAVAPEVRGRGLSIALFHRVIRAAADQGYRKIISALVRRGNASEGLFRPHHEPGVDTWTREYVLLSRQVSG
jgi:GNAT superfamily N-acetyltransferase